MTDTKIIRVEDWDRSRRLCKLFGLRAAIIYAGTRPNSLIRQIACDQRIRVKTWANQRLGLPITQSRRGIEEQEYQYLNTDSLWYQGYNDQGEYVIAFCDPKLRDWALLL